MLILIKFIKNKTDFAGLSSKVVNLIQRLTTDCKKGKQN